MAKEQKFGTGITQRVDRVIDAEDATEEDMRELKKDMDAVNQYQRNGGNMAYIRERARAILNQDKEPLTEQSRKWYAREALNLLNFVKGYADSGDTTEALNIAISLGALWKQAEMKFEFEADALRGLGQKENLGEGRKQGTESNKAAAEQKHKDMRTMDSGLRRYHPHKNEDARIDHIRTQVTKSNGEPYSVDYIRRQLKK